MLAAWWWPLRSRLLVATLLSLAFVGCPCLRGPVNASPELRWWLFSNFGANRICPEMLARSAPLRLAPNPNVVGRLYPEQCQTTVNDEARTITLAFSAGGLAWTPIAGRVAFNVLASVEYKMDFYLADDAVYVWARPARVVTGPVFQVTAVEMKLFDSAAQGPLAYLVNGFGSQVVSAELASGFTVVHADDGDSFALGQLSPPARPAQAFATTQGRRLLASETTEVHEDQIDLAGPFTLDGTDHALFFRGTVTGPAVDVLVLPRGTADLFRHGLSAGAPLGPPPAPPVYSFTLAPGAPVEQRLPLVPGQYDVLFDNSPRLGSVSPPWSLFGVVGGNTALVSYSVELGDAG